MQTTYWKTARYQPLSPEVFERRFRQKYVVDEASGCWVWKATRNKRGQGLMSDGVRQQKAHKLAYLYFVFGQIPAMHYVAQTCKNVACVRPEHLVLMKAGGASREGNSPFAKNAQKTHCIHGHLFTASNTIVYRGRRRCGTCQDAWRKRPKHSDELALLESVRERFSEKAILERVRGGGGGMTSEEFYKFCYPPRMDGRCWACMTEDWLSKASCESLEAAQPCNHPHTCGKVAR